MPSTQRASRPLLFSLCVRFHFFLFFFFTVTGTSVGGGGGRWWGAALTTRPSLPLKDLPTLASIVLLAYYVPCIALMLASHSLSVVCFFLVVRISRWLAQRECARVECSMQHAQLNLLQTRLQVNNSNNKRRKKKQKKKKKKKR